MTIRFDDKVAIVTGGGNGLGREHCLALASRGAKVVVNDLGGSLDGSGESSSAARSVVNEIQAAGGEAVANGADITNLDQVKVMVNDTMVKWGRVDILVNNAGILRDKTFSKMDVGDFKKVVDVHLFGTLNCTKAVWEIMKNQGYGRIVMTSSSSGIFGNFGQSNYGAAKAAVVGLMNVLHHEGKKYDIRVNCLSPTAATRMLDGLVSDEVVPLMSPALVSPGVLYLVSNDAPSKTILGAGAGCFSVIRIFESKGAFVGSYDISVDDVAANWEAISDPCGQDELTASVMQTTKFVETAANALGIELVDAG